MAKKRVHELAKQYDMPMPEVVKRLQAYGIEVKAAATAVDEKLADAALTGKAKPKAASNGAPAKKAPPVVQQRAGFGHGTARAPRAENLPKPKAKPSQPPRGEDSRPPGQRNGQGGPGQGQRPNQSRPPAGARPADGQRQRPTRSSLQGERAPGAGGGVRRVVIDSQASRRGPGGGPGGPGGGPGGPGGGPPQRPPRRRGGRRRRGTYTEPTPQDVSSLKADVIKVNSGSTVKDVAEYLGVPVPEIIKKLMGLGEMATLTQTLSDDAIQVIADEFDKEIEIVTAADDPGADPEYEDDDEDLEPRPPVVTIMGHVDHGKTSLLDAIRSTEVAAGEAGGITQHIGAYQVHQDGKTVTFLDTPGHEAFTAMRARGAQSTDIVVIVVAADDGVKPQTREAVDHAKAADVPILVAVNKIDKEGAAPDRVRTEMTQLGLQPEEWGGDTMFVDVSAKTQQGLPDLLEGILLTAELEELKANPDTEASGVVIESKLDPGRGAVVTVLVQRGTLKIGDAIVAGAHWGRVRAMSDFTGKRVKVATPSEPVEVLGFDTVPEAGEHVRVVENDRRARSLANERATRLKLEQQARRGGIKRSLATIFDQPGAVTDLSLVLKADVSGSLEAFEDEIAKLPQDEISVQIVRSGVGGITESDINLAAASDAIVLGFNVRPVGDARQLADREGVEIRTYSVIYRAIDELRDAMQGLLAPETVEDIVGQLEVREIFRASRIGTIAGCMVTDGKVTRGAKVRLIRDGAVVHDGEIGSLRRFNDDVREVLSGFECGVVLANYSNVEQGDTMEVYETRQVERTLS
ncbi:translation initiation factor IF-2 [Candidatus Solirubrobacter pratensis]|uniref:translation initiation factor IF-2 n=1 Tax=Candidatus Solirubrobacter pratensis TaxID=1298857 RepID=UPI000407ACA9|nr:translation initiation factor IF-2 [Candidatus Solirubrobacter pratensis]